jgi:hypothetical protein
LNLFFSYDLTPSKAYIIRVVGHEDSEKKAAHCAESCDNVGQEWEYWDAYNGIDGELKAPSHHNPIMDCIKSNRPLHDAGRSSLCAVPHKPLG